jgi:hypothetical protein
MRLSLKNSNGARLGRKIGGAARVAVKDSEGISQRAGQIESVAGTIGTVAGAGAGFATATGFGAPVAGALGSIAVGAVAGQKAAGAIKSGADRVTKTRNTLNQVDGLFGR